MTSYRQILTRMRSGDSDRRIARAEVIDRSELAALRRLGQRTGWLDPRRPLPEDSMVFAQLHPTDMTTSDRVASDPPRVDASERSSAVPASPWYVALGERGEQLLSGGRVEQAAEVFENLLARLGDAPSFPRTVALGRLAECHRASGTHAQALQRLQQALDDIARLAPTAGLRALRGRLQSQLGELLQCEGRSGEARQAFESALRIAQETRDRRAEGIERSRLGALALTQGEVADALTHCRAALAALCEVPDPAMQAAAWHQLGVVLHEQHQWVEAERHYREAARMREQLALVGPAQQSWIRLARLNQDRGDEQSAEALYRKAIDAGALRADRPPPSAHMPAQLADALIGLAGLLSKQAARLDEAFTLAQSALELHQSVDPRAAPVWQAYGLMAELLTAQADLTEDVRRRDELRTQAGNCRQLQIFAPRFLAALSRLGAEASFARAVVLERLVRCFLLSGRGDLAIWHAREALSVIDRLTPCESLEALRGPLLQELGGMYREMGRAAEASWADAEAARLGQAPFSTSVPTDAERMTTDLPFRIRFEDDEITEYGLEDDLLVDGPRAHRLADWTPTPIPLAGDLRPMLMPCVRTTLDADGAVRLHLPPRAPAFEPHRACTVIRRLHRQVRVTGSSTVLWSLIGAIDGSRRVDAVVSQFAPDERDVAAALLTALAQVGAIDVSGRAFGRFIHGATRKGVLPAGGLEGDDVLRLVIEDGDDDASTSVGINLSREVPAGLQAFHALTRSRRSRRDFHGAAMARRDFAALLHTACGITGAMTWEAREVKLRAYPSSGGLYAVRIRPVVLRVDGLTPGVYRYLPGKSCLVPDEATFEASAYLDAMLPMERNMVSGAAAMICLTGNFPRHEKKYGEGGYRMLVAEAGHISQNLVLASFALGLSARPFGGVFDDLLNRKLGLDDEREQFLLSVLVGHAG